MNANIFACTFLLVVLLSASGCGKPEPYKFTMVITDRGLVSARYSRCVLGMLLNDDMINIRDERSEPVTCTGYIKLTSEEVVSYRAKSDQASPITPLEESK